MNSDNTFNSLDKHNYNCYAIIRFRSPSHRNKIKQYIPLSKIEILSAEKIKAIFSESTQHICFPFKYLDFFCSIKIKALNTLNDSRYFHKKFSLFIPSAPVDSTYDFYSLDSKLKGKVEFLCKNEFEKYIQSMKRSRSNDSEDPHESVPYSNPFGQSKPNTLHPGQGAVYRLVKFEVNIDISEVSFT